MNTSSSFIRSFYKLFLSLDGLEFFVFQMSLFLFRKMNMVVCRNISNLTFFVIQIKWICETYYLANLFSKTAWK